MSQSIPVRDHVQEALAKIDEWAVTADQPGGLVVEPGSSLAGDDAKLPTLLVSSTVA
ncbi:hypothetical protein ACIBL6_20400 [Streptomyces sp. NPDC050400]|uniref:hypothetical protein n=1 Tax=Streptomyces sp. NPDC050400 TaxID=3365610 RepID=UPI003794E30E